MKRMLLIIHFVVMVLCAHAEWKVMHILPSTKVYMESMRWSSVDAELRDYLRYMAVNGDSFQSSQCSQALSDIRYNSYELVIDGELVIINVSNGNEYRIGPAQKLWGVISSIISTSCIFVSRFASGTEIRWNLSAQDGESTKAELHYSQVSNGGWAAPQTVEMESVFNPVKQMLSFSHVLQENCFLEDTVEFVLHVYASGYDYWLNNEGRNYRL